ncbi:MAG: polysaccharide biosynthesis tyrosine autokinase [Phycisphaerae bacterium]|nr:polysaccharide biosynthesis tyrosine autokinase [Tepidisphaeraceae bacterium]
MSNNRSIQKLGQRERGAVMTSQGPAVIQVIDIPGAGAMGGYAGGGMGGSMPVRKVGGINIVGAILRRWWLVVLVTAVIGGAGVFTANNFLKPTYVVKSIVRWTDKTPDGLMTRLAGQSGEVLTSQRIPVLAAQDPDLQAAMPNLVRGRDMTDPAVQVDVVKQLKEIAVADVDKKLGVIYIQCSRANGAEAAAIANAFARAVVKFCKDELHGEITSLKTQLEELVKEKRTVKAALLGSKTELAIQHGIDRIDPSTANALSMVQKMTDEQLAARVQFAAADAKLQQIQNGGQLRADQKLAAIKMFEEEKAKDNVLLTYNQQYVAAMADLEQKRATMKEEHPEVRRQLEQVNRLKQMTLKREAEISSIINNRIEAQFKLMDAKTVAEAQEKVDNAKKMLEFYTTELAKLDEKSKKLIYVKGQIQALDDQIALVGRDYDVSYAGLQDMINQERQFRLNSGIDVAELAQTPDAPNDDKRVKVQAAGMVGGLFLGMLLALLVDKFDRRLRDPRDVEPLLGAPLLGTIPKINELKRVKGEHARNLIAEEFRVIRTQLLFGNPELQYKSIAITSPQPGDGKTSLAVNLAISIAKAGRRVLLIDGDLRKPDIHRIFNISDSPGFAEVIAGSHEPGTVIKKSDIDGLEVLPAGTPIIRPSELLSRPEVARVLAALGEVYDHIILDTAPLLPVSDTHVLVGLVDGVMCSFSAEVERDTVTLIQDILRRGHANVIGTVLNRVKYKQSGSYQRGKNAYSAYYSTTRVPPTDGSKTQLPPASKIDPSVATLSKH